MTAAATMKTTTTANKEAATTRSKVTVALPNTGVNAELVERAVSALLKHHEQVTNKSAQESGKLQLLGVDRPLQIQITLERVPSLHMHKPKRVLIPHPLYKVYSEGDEMAGVVGVEEPSVCLIVKDDSKPWVKEMITRFQKYMGCVQKVMGLDSLRKKHAQFQQRRELLHKYDVFMADMRILPMVGKALGREFYKHKKLPIPIDLTRKEALPFAVQKSLRATFFTLSQGNCVMVRAGNTGMPAQNLVENVVAICQKAVPKIPRKWANIQSIAIKTPESISLPIYSKTPEELAEIARAAGLERRKKHNDSTKTASVDSEEDEESESDKDDDKDQGKAKQEGEKRRKKKIVTKSPLVRAVKRQLESTKEQKESSPTKKHKSDTPASPSEIARQNKHKKESTENEPTTDSKASNKKHTETKQSTHDRPSEHTNDRKSKDLAKESDKQKSKLKRGVEAGGEDQEGTPKTKKSKSDKTAEADEKEDKQKSPNLKQDSDSNARMESVTPSHKKTNSAKKVNDESSQSKKKIEYAANMKGNITSSPNEKETNSPAPFIPSPKFTGSKPGYAFKKGARGVGYYVDVKPVVDPLVIDALTKMAESSPSSVGGGRKSKKSKGSSAESSPSSVGGGRKSKKSKGSSGKHKSRRHSR